MVGLWGFETLVRACRSKRSDRPNTLVEFLIGCKDILV